MENQMQNITKVEAKNAALAVQGRIGENFGKKVSLQPSSRDSGGGAQLRKLARHEQQVGGSTKLQYAPASSNAGCTTSPRMAVRAPAFHIESTTRRMALKS